MLALMENNYLQQFSNFYPFPDYSQNKKPTSITILMSNVRNMTMMSTMSVIFIPLIALLFLQIHDKTFRANIFIQAGFLHLYCNIDGHDQ